MIEITGIGASVFDTLLSLDTYPEEDTKSPALSTKTCGGGPVATGLCAAAKLGRKVSFIGKLADDDAGNFLKADFEKWGVSTKFCELLPNTSSFRSVLWLAKDKGTRTCVFDRGNVPEKSLSQEEKAEIMNAKVLMVDGNRLTTALEGAAVAKKGKTKVLYDCGGLYDGVEKLLALTDIMIPSKEFALNITGACNVKAAAEKLFMTYSPEVVVVTCGKAGGVLFDGESFYEYPAFKVSVLDSNGAGDVFHGAFAAGLTYGFDYIKCCHFASAVSAIKCTGIGARESVPDFATVIKYLKENGYEL